jgi:proline racemase
MALAYAKNLRSVGQKWAYNSIVSNHFGTGAFVASIVDDNARVGGSKEAVIVRVEGKAYYTGTSNFILEEGDLTSASGFTLKACAE